MLKAISKGVAKKGLHPASIVHFRFEETGGGITTTVKDAVSDYDIDFSDAVGAFGSVRVDVEPNAVTSFYAESPSKIPYTNFITGKVTQELTSGVVVIYSCAKYLPIGTDSQEDGSGNPTGGNGARLLAPMDQGFHGSANHTPIFFYEYNRYVDTLKEQSTVIFGDSSSNDSPPNFVGVNRVDLDITGNHVFAGNLVSYCFAFEIGADMTPKLIWSDGFQERFSNRNIPSWYLPEMEFAIRNCHAYTTGMLHLEKMPIDSDMQACAEWHRINAPKGNKDVWYGWNSYAAA